MTTASSADTQPSTTYRVRPLSVVSEGDEFLVGDVERGEFVLLPEVGVQVLRLLQAGKTPAETASAIGPEVDVPDFLTTMEELGFIAPVPDQKREAGLEANSQSPRTSWLLRALFSRAAWLVYALSGVLTVALIAYRPALFPTYRDIFFLPSPVVSVACVTLLMYVFAALHEVCHWTAARAAGLQSRITVSRRLYFLAFETDLTRLWALPRRQRYGPLVAGMTFDTLVLCLAIVARWAGIEGWWPVPPELDKLLGALAFTQIAALAAQCYVFMRTDVYALLITATGCVNLWRVNQLRLLGVLRPLNASQQHELDAAHSRDLQVARWYSLVYAAGVMLAAAFFVFYFLPATVLLFTSMFETVRAAAVGTLDFWATLLFAAIVLSPRALTAAIILRDGFGYLRRRRRKSGPREQAVVLD